MNIVNREAQNTEVEIQSFDAENLKIRQSLIQDPSLTKLLEKIPQDVQDSFTEEQLANLKIAVSARSWGKHAIDFRSTIKFFRYRYYYVFVAGRNLRELSRKEKQMSLFVQAFFGTVFLFFCTGLGLLVLYLIKSALGINIIDGYSFGVWDWFKSIFN